MSHSGPNAGSSRPRRRYSNANNDDNEWPDLLREFHALRGEMEILDRDPRPSMRAMEQVSQRLEALNARLERRAGVSSNRPSRATHAERESPGGYIFEYPRSVPHDPAFNPEVRGDGSGRGRGGARPRSLPQRGFEDNRRRGRAPSPQPAFCPGREELGGYRRRYSHVPSPAFSPETPSHRSGYGRARSLPSREFESRRRSAYGSLYSADRLNHGPTGSSYSHFFASGKPLGSHTRIDTYDFLGPGGRSTRYTPEPGAHPSSPASAARHSHRRVSSADGAEVEYGSGRVYRNVDEQWDPRNVGSRDV
ncbi:hypothetical protein CC80DRAFT_570285 [Byssothecium circinans]|uniref:Uncharacterized protein n=1 Tax=Byssothecium circinans TaxID=147558 RepID=A0A6A5UHI2_9PLEO|nr:hypothetical protein CC80DRAFT_570285 [Byssothecium circinans]